MDPLFRCGLGCGILTAFRASSELQSQILRCSSVVRVRLLTCTSSAGICVEPRAKQEKKSVLLRLLCPFLGVFLSVFVALRKHCDKLKTTRLGRIVKQEVDLNKKLETVHFLRPCWVVSSLRYRPTERIKTTKPHACGNATQSMLSCHLSMTGIGAPVFFAYSCR